MKRFVYYLNIWWKMSVNSFLVWLNQKLLFAIFLFGKLIRFFFFFSFLFLITNGAQTVAGYSTNQIIFFFLTFNLIDIVAQFMFREVYRFRPLIVSGDFDLILTMPYNSLFRVLMGGADIIDLVTIFPLIYAIYYFGIRLNPIPVNVIFYLVLVVNGLLIATAFHIAVLALAIVTLEIDHAVMIYRDLTSLGRFPIDIYKEPLRGILTFLIPVGIMLTIPAKALMGLISPVGIIGSVVFGFILLFISLAFWNFALKKYSSASS